MEVGSAVTAEPCKIVLLTTARRYTAHQFYTPSKRSKRRRFKYEACGLDIFFKR